MRILLLPQAFPPVRGGGEWHAWRLAAALAASGETVRVVTSNLMRVIARGEHGAPPIGPASETTDGVAIHRIEYGTPRSRFLLRSPWTPFPFRRQARRRAYARYLADFEARVEAELDAFAPDVVLTMAHLQASVRTAFRLRARRPFPLAFLPLLHLEDPAARGDEMRGYLREADAVLTNTDLERRFVVDDVGVGEERVFTCGLGVDLPAAAEPLPPRHVLFVGRLDPDKGIDRLASAMAHLRRDGFDLPLQLVGTRCDGTRRVLRDLAGEAGIRIAIDASDAERDLAIRKAACLVLPSRLESFGLVLLEAWAQGVPVVTWDLPLYREIVTPGVDGLLARPDDTGDLGTAIRRIAEDPALRTRLGRAGRARVERDHTWHAVAARAREALVSAL